MTQFDIQYRNLAERILTDGQEHVTRAKDPDTGVNLKAKKVFHGGFFFDLREEFPILTTKQMPMSKSKPENGFLFASEMFWIWVMGSNRVQDLRDLGNTVWDEWELADGTIGKSYGYQARQLKAVRRIYEGDTPRDHLYEEENIDQVKNLIESIRQDPMGRRHMVDLWNVADFEDMALPPCAFLSIWDVTPDGYLNCHLVQRSGDYAMGIPFNVSQYAMLVHMVAQVTGLKPGYLAHDITNVHIYENHYDLVERQLNRKPLDCKPQLWVNPDVTEFDDFKLTDVKVIGYESHGPLKGKIGV